MKIELLDGAAADLRGLVIARPHAAADVFVLLEELSADSSAIEAAASCSNGENSPQEGTPDMSVTSSSVSRPRSASRRKNPPLSLEALAREFEQDPRMAEPLSVARRNLGNMIGEGEGTLRGLRLAAGLSQASLAAAAGLTQSHVALIEGGRTGTIAKLAAALGVNEELLFNAIRESLRSVVQDDGVRFKTLAKNVVAAPPQTLVKPRP